MGLYILLYVIGWDTTIFPPMSVVTDTGPILDSSPGISNTNLTKTVTFMI